LLVLGQVAVGLQRGSALDLVLVVGHLDAVAGVLGLGEGHEGDLGREQPAGDRGPLGLAGLVVQVDGVDRAQLVAGRVDHGPTLPTLDGVDTGCWHATSLSVACDGWYWVGGGLQGWARPCDTVRRTGCGRFLWRAKQDDSQGGVAYRGSVFATVARDLGASLGTVLPSYGSADNGWVAPYRAHKPAESARTAQQRNHSCSLGPTKQAARLPPRSPSSRPTAGSGPQPAPAASVLRR